ncbi:unnamed protein product [Sphacelaria rigidula]
MLKLDQYHLTLPISTSMVYSWVTKLGCTYEGHSQTYFTDGHERPVVHSRNVYIEQKRSIALRQPLWVRVEKSSLSPQELANFDNLKKSGDEDFYAEVYDCEIDGKACIEFHVDLLNDGGVIETFDALRSALGRDGGHYSVRFPEAARASCKAQHSKEVCKCDREVYYIGQGESISKAFALEVNEWVIQSVRGPRKKTEGPAEMVSAFQDETRGFGLPLSQDELDRVTKFREERGRSALKRTPGTRHLVFGKDKGGSWDFDRFEKQFVDVMDVLEVIEKDKQIVFEVDHSAGHSKMREDGLHTSYMNVKYGGTQRMLRNTKVTEGLYSPGAKPYPRKLAVGDTQRMVFQAGDPPPFYDVDAPQRDTKEVREKASNKNDNALVSEGGGTEGATSATATTEEWIRECYVGKPKGMKQVLWERGLWVDKMRTGDEVQPEENMATVLGKFAGLSERENSTAAHHRESWPHPGAIAQIPPRGCRGWDRIFLGDVEGALSAGNQ